MTSNLGQEVLNETEGTKETKEKRQKRVMEVLHGHFKPEFLNRLDGTIVYNPLSPKDLVEIAKQQLELVRERMQENNIDLKITDDVAFYFAEVGYDPIFGARPLRRAIEEQLVDEIAMRIIEGTVKPGDTISPTVKDNKIVL